MRWAKIAGWMLVAAVAFQFLLLYAQDRIAVLLDGPRALGEAVGAMLFIFLVGMVVASLTAFGPKARLTPVLSPVISGVIASLIVTALIWIGAGS